MQHDSISQEPSLEYLASEFDRLKQIFGLLQVA
jgi:hypothetical protein